jgi:hypothetical protein
MPDSQIALRFLLPLIACVGALFVGWFITCDPNPLTTSTMLAGLVMCCVALSNPVWGVYLLILTTGYLDLVKRLGILSDALSGIDVVVLFGADSNELSVNQIPIGGAQQIQEGMKRKGTGLTRPD